MIKQINKKSFKINEELTAIPCPFSVDFQLLSLLMSNLSTQLDPTSPISSIYLEETVDGESC